MKKKTTDGKTCIRCGKKTPSPYLKKIEPFIRFMIGPFNKPEDVHVLDVGCGNGRNSEFMKKIGYKVTSIDMVDDYGKKVLLGKEKFPEKKFDIYLLNYVLMFLSKEERMHVIKEIERTSNGPSSIVIEMYPALDSEEYNWEGLVSSLQERQWFRFDIQKDHGLFLYRGKK